jgi:hypothetical protein
VKIEARGHDEQQRKTTLTLYNMLEEEFWRHVLHMHVFASVSYRRYSQPSPSNISLPELISDEVVRHAEPRILLGGQSVLSKV